jgi:hypothetical protein
MNAYGSTSLFGMLMATSLVSGATAMEINQQRAPATGEPPAFTMPAFLDGARLPDLQEAWRAHFSDPNETAIVQPASEVTTPTSEAALETAQQAMTRAEQAGREAAAVRIRAEELSRRFGAGDESAPQPAASTETASINTDATGANATPPPVADTVLAPADDSAASDTASATNDAPVIENMAKKPAKPVKRSTAPIPQRQPVQTATQNAPVVSTLLKVDPAAPKPEENPMLPDQLRAFGWNAQP